MSKINIESLMKQYSGNKWKTASKAAKFFQYGEVELSIRFIKYKQLAEYLIENYEDYLFQEDISNKTKFNCIKSGKWVDVNLIPVASVKENSDEDDSDEDFLESSTGFLFCDLENSRFIYANTDEWSRKNAFDDLNILGLHEG
jgi:hypothetical protein